MRRRSSMIAWCCALAALVSWVLIAMASPLVAAIFSGIMITAGAVMLMWSAATQHPPRELLVTALALGSAAIAAVLVAALRVDGATAPTAELISEVPLVLPILVIATTLIIIVAASKMVRRRRLGLTTRDAIDAAIVGAGAALATWIAFAEPMFENHALQSEWAIITMLALPLAMVALAVTAVLVSSGLVTNRAAWLLLIATALHGGTCAVAAVARRSDIGDGDQVVSGLTGFLIATWPYSSVVAFGFVVAAVAHPSARAIPRPINDPGMLRVSTRLILVLLALVGPLAMVAAIPADSATDRMVRTIGTLVLAALASARLMRAIAANELAEQRLHDRDRSDELTRLPNRARFLEEVTAALDDTWRTRHRPAVLQLNIDRFKNINDSLGHDLADAVLLELAGRLRELAAPFDGVVARISGDEFAVLVPDADEASAEQRAEEIRAAFAHPVLIEDQSVFATASIGYSVAPRHRILSADEFLRRADVAMHRAKAAGRNRAARFDDSMLENVSHRLDIESALHGAIERSEFFMEHQPIIDLSTGQVSGFEALIRWRRADGTLMRPDQFISVAEETGLIVEMGAWALTESLCALRRWIEAGTVPATATMSVNVSPRQIADARLPEIVKNAITTAGLPPELLWIEVTESMMMSEPDLARSTLGELSAMGVRVALDDFGTGYSSLSLLQGFQLHRLKIDRAFIRGVAEDDQDRSLVRTILAMAEALDLDVVAEGVETIEQLGTLRSLGCAKAQGFLISRPIPAEMMHSTMIALGDFGDLSVFTGRDESIPGVAAAFDGANSAG